MRHRPRSFGLVLTLLILLITPLGATASTQPVARPTAKTTEGWVRGEAGDGYRVFRGLPFAAPPTGDRRWHPPQPATAWSGLREAVRSANPCPQPANFLIGPDSGSEDCLYLEVTAPDAATPGTPKPVMVWIHGGGFIGGAGSLVDPHRLAVQGDVVVVTVNYRLGPLGFLSLPGLEGAGTFGLQDQQAALGWVQRNIAAFGGNPGNVTLFGQSAGSLSICAHLASPDAGELFHRAILQSGPCSLTIATDPSGAGGRAAFIPLADAEASGSLLGLALGCLGPDRLDCLRAVPAETLTQSPLWWTFTSPAYGTPLLPADPTAALDAGRFHQVPVLLGTTRLELLSLFIAPQLPNPMPAAVYEDLLGATFGPAAAGIAEQYAAMARESPAVAWASILTDIVFACPNLAISESLSAHVPVHLYDFADPNPPLQAALTGIPPGAYHAAEVQYLMDEPFDPRPLDPAQEDLAAAMIRYWTNFAHTGDPNGAGLPAWPPFEPAAGPNALSLAPGPDGIAPIDYGATYRCDFWATLAGE